MGKVWVAVTGLVQVHAGGSSPVLDPFQYFHPMVFISVLLGLMDFNDIVWLAK